MGHSVLYLLNKGYRVLAIDSEPEALRRLEQRLPQDAPVKLLKASFEELELPQLEVAVAIFSLFFLKPEEFDSFWKKLVAALVPGGLFVGQFLGIHDDWTERGYTVQDADQVRSLLSQFEILYWEEVERDGETAQGTPKHWHVFHVVARKNA